MKPGRSGFLLLNKSTGVTSFESLKTIKKIFSTGKAGHTGTLDKFASGLLLVLVGRAVKLSSIFLNCNKEYVGNIHFGEETNTLDSEGSVIARGKIPSRDEVEAVLDNFRGAILQIPPAYSAIHINGRRAYELARDGKEPLMKERSVTVFELEIISWNPPEAEIRAYVSSGTYIRSLARDIALAAGSRAYLSALKRTRLGPFRLEDAFNAGDGEKNMEDVLRPLDPDVFASLSIPCVFIDEKAASGFLQGKSLTCLLSGGTFSPSISAFNDAAKAGVFKKGAGGELLGLLENKDGKWAYSYVFTNN